MQICQVNGVVEPDCFFLDNGQDRVRRRVRRGAKIWNDERNRDKEISMYTDNIHPLEGGHIPGTTIHRGARDRPDGIITLYRQLCHPGTSFGDEG
jgi:hypothetical protein